VRALNGERQRLRPVLGDAAYRNDDDALSILRARMHEIDDAVAARERARVDTVARARARADDARDAGRPTEVLVATGTDTDNGAEADDEPEPKPPD
jgi:hypothetical protein